MIARKGLLLGAPGLLARRPGGARYQVGWIGELADRVKFVESMQTGRAGQTIPVVAATLPPAVDPGLANLGMGERTEVARFAMYAMLITAQKCSFHRITLESSHWVLPSVVDWCSCGLMARPGR